MSTTLILILALVAVLAVGAHIAWIFSKSFEEHCIFETSDEQCDKQKEHAERHVIEPVEASEQKQCEYIRDAKTKAQERAIFAAGTLPKFITDADIDMWNMEVFDDCHFDSSECSGKGDFPEDDITIGVALLRERFHIDFNNRSQVNRVHTAFVATTKFILGDINGYDIKKNYRSVYNVSRQIKNAETGDYFKNLELKMLYKNGIRLVISEQLCK